MNLPARVVRDVAACCLLVAAALPPLAAQDPAGAQAPASPPDQVFRGAVDFVRVDAYPRRNGLVVEGLTAADFSILEDGQPQAIDTFEFVRHAADPAYERLDPRNRAEAERWLADPQRRLFIVYLDLYHITRVASHQIRGPLMQVLSESIGPSDVVAVMTPETLIGDLQFTQTLNTVAAEIERYWEWGLEDAPVWPRNPAETRLAACGDSRSGFTEILKRFREAVFFTSLESLIAHVSALRQDRTNVILLSEGWHNRQGGIDIRNLNSLPGRGHIPIGQQMGMPPGPGRSGTDQFGRPVTGTATARTPSCTEQLVRLEVDFEDRFKQLFRLANANNVSFHTIDVGGLRTGAATADFTTTELLAGRRAPMGHPQVLQTLAENTDGVSTINTNDIALGLRRVVEHTSAYYLLGYASTNTATDGRYRRIDVRVNQRGVDVTARRGYMAISSNMQQRADTRAIRSAVPAPVAAALGTLARWDDGRATRDGSDLAAAPAVVTPATPILGQAEMFRIPAIGRPTPQTALSPVFRRGERLRLEWRPSAVPSSHIVRLLDRRGQTLTPGAALIASFDNHTRVLRVDLHIAALAEGDYVVEVALGDGDDDERQIVAFRVGR